MEFGPIPEYIRQSISHDVVRALVISRITQCTTPLSSSIQLLEFPPEPFHSPDSSIFTRFWETQRICCFGLISQYPDSK